MLTNVQRKAFQQFPDLDEGTLHLHYTLSGPELDCVMEKQGDASRLGYALHLKIMGHLVRDPETLEVPRYVIQHVASQLGLPAGLYLEYRSGKQATLKQHRQDIKRRLGLTSCKQLELYRDFSSFLKPHALQLCAGFPLMVLLVDEMRKRKVLWGKVGPLEKTVHQALDWAERHTQDVLLAGFKKADELPLTKLLQPSKNFADTGHHKLGWFREKHLDASPKSITSLLDKLRFLRDLELPWEKLKLIPRSRQETLFRESRFLHAQQLLQMAPRKRWSTLLLILMDLTVQITDQVFDLHAKIMQAQLRNCRNRYLEDLQDSQLGLADALLLHRKVGEVWIEAREQGADPYQAMDRVVEWETFVKSVRSVGELTHQTEFDSLSLMRGRLDHFRQYSSKLLSHFTFGSSTADAPFLEAIGVVKTLAADPEMEVPADAPLDFVSGRWSKFVVQDGKVDPAYYELCLLDTLTRKLHAGDVHLERSRKYRHFEDYLLSKDTWRTHLKQHPLMVAEDFTVFWEDQMKQLGDQLSEVDLKLREGKLTDVRMEAGKVVVSRNRRDITVSGKAKRLGKRLYGMIPTIKITDIMLEVDTWTLYQSHFKHFSLTKTVENVQELYSVILAEGTNLSLRKMAHATNPVNFKRLALVREYFVREETFRAAQAVLVNYHTKLPIAQLWGDGEHSASDGQRFLAAQKASDSGTFNRRYGREPGVTFYTHVSDQYSPFYTKVIASNERDAVHILDGLLYHQSDLRIKEHTSDTHGFTEAVFALLNLLGFHFTPRIRDLKHLKIFVPDRRKKYPTLGSVVGGGYNRTLVSRHWEDILRLVTSVKSGHVTASVILRKLSSFQRRNSLLAALIEVGKIYRTRFMLNWWSDPVMRRVVQRNLNKGELFHDLKRAVFCHGRGEVRDNSLFSQERRAGGLNFLSSLISTWNAVYLQAVVRELRSQGEKIDDEILSHISPLRFEHIVFSGDYVWRKDLLPPEGKLRPLVGMEMAAD